MAAIDHSKAGVYSTLGTDPDLGELVEMFVEEMPDRIATLQQAFDACDKESLQRAAHQMKGAAGSYGFDQLTPFAAGVEGSLREEQPETIIRERLEELLDLCRRVRAGGPEATT